jgi:hypothetical protein
MALKPVCVEISGTFRWSQKVSKPHLGFTSSRRGFNVIFFRASCNFGMLWRTKDGEWSEKDSATCCRSRAHFPPHFREMDVHLEEGNSFLLLHCRQRHCHTSTRVKTVVNETSWEILFIILRKRHLKVPSRMCREQDKFNNWTTKMNTFDLSNYFLLLIVCKETFMSLLDSFFMAANAMCPNIKVDLSQAVLKF